MSLPSSSFYLNFKVYSYVLVFCRGIKKTKKSQGPFTGTEYFHHTGFFISLKPENDTK